MKKLNKRIKKIKQGRALPKKKLQNKPWALLRISRKEYETIKPWKQMKISRAKFEEMLILFKVQYSIALY